ncbi:MAG: PDZ domain-containing protein [Bryobacteraceae bacterium]
MKHGWLILVAAGLMVAGTLAAQPVPPPPPTPPAPPVVLAQLEVFSGGGYLGVGVADINSERMKALKLKEERGAEITRVEPDSPAAKAGLKVGDVVLEYNGQRVESAQQFSRMVRETPEGRQARLLISREGNTQTLTATIGARKVMGMSRADQDRLQEQMKRLQEKLGDLRFQIADVPQVFTAIRSGGLGIEAESLNDQLAEYFGVKEGVLVRRVLKDTPAQKAGLKAGDVIVRVDGVSVDEPQDITRQLRTLREKKTFPLTVVRDRKEMTLQVTIEPAPRPSAVRPSRPRLVAGEERL